MKQRMTHLMVNPTLKKNLKTHPSQNTTTPAAAASAEEKEDVDVFGLKREPPKD
jgi:hypothetical protein